MKKYTDYYSTPLKFHKFFHYVWTPVTLLISLVVLFIMFRSFSYNNIGSAVYITFAVFNFALTIAYFIGFFRWKKYAWYCLFAQLISEAVLYTVTFILSVFILPQYILTLAGVIIGFSIRGIPMSIYYYKRRGLFSTEGFNPKNTNKTDSAQTSASAENRFCTHCGHPTAAGNAFCINCGSILTQNPASGEAAQPHQYEVSENCCTETAVTAETAATTTAVTDDTASAEQCNLTVPALSVQKTKKGRIKKIAVIAAIAVLAVTNLVQLGMVSKYKSEAAGLSAEVDTLKRVNDDYRVQLNKALTKDTKNYTKAGYFDTISNFLINEVPSYKSTKYYSDRYLIFMAEGEKDKIKITANYNDATVSHQLSGNSVDTEYAEFWSGYSIDVNITALSKGLTTIYFTNDKDSTDFKVLVFVI